MLAASSGWNDAALLAVYRRGLWPEIRRQMAIYDGSADLKAFMIKAQSVSHLTVVTVEGTYISDTSPQEEASASEPHADGRIPSP